MLKLKTSESEALVRLERIPSATFRAEISSYWRVRPSGRPSAQSVCWLFCWASPEESTPKCAEAARDAFDAIFDRPYVWMERRVSLSWARQARESDGDIELLFRKVLDLG